MAVKIKAVKIPLKDLARALIDKTTPLYVNKPTWGPRNYNYEEDIYPQARMAFPEYNKLYPDNNDFSKYFTRDYYKHDPKVLESLSRPLTGQPVEASVPDAGEPAATMTPPNLGSQPSPVIPATSSPRFQAPRIPGGLSNAAKNFGSAASIFTKKGGNSLASGLSGFLGGAVGAGGRGLGSLGLKAVNGAADRWQAANRFKNSIGSSLKGKSRSKFGAGQKFALGIIGAMILLGGLAVIGNQQGTTPTGEAAPIPGSVGIGSSAPLAGSPGNLAQCSFSGVSGNLKAGNPTLANIVSDISAKVGVPGSIIMGILRIESSDKFVNKDPNYLANDYDATPSSAGALGIAQFMPGTFEGIFRANRPDISQKFQKDKVSVTVGPAINPPPNDNIMRITSIRDSVIMAAYKAKNDKDFAVGNTARWDANAARAVAKAYYGACSYEGAGGSYCTDLAQSFDNCKVSSASLADSGQIGQIVQGIQNSCTGGIVIRSNLSCLNSVAPPLPATVDSKIRESTLTYGALQCVGYVKALASWVNNETLNDHNVANAYDYQAIPPSGYRFVSKGDDSAIMIGDIAIWNNAPNGHVAYVTGVESTNRFLVTEASWGPQGYVRMDRYIDKLSEKGFQGWARRL